MTAEQRMIADPMFHSRVKLVSLKLGGVSAAGRAMVASVLNAHDEVMVGPSEEDIKTARRMAERMLPPPMTTEQIREMAGL